MIKLITCLRQLSADHFTSGEAVAEKLGISRASVSMTLSRAEQYGVAIERRHGLGYRLQIPLEWLDPLRVAASQPAGSEMQVSVTDCIESTNRALLTEHGHGRVLAAEWQRGGRGRMGRHWQGGVGGSLLFSLAWVFPDGPAQLAGLPLAVGVALARAIRAVGIDGITLKWPNDLLLPGGKVGGILIEMQGDAMGPAQVVIGVGLNLRSPESWHAVLDQPAASLQDAGWMSGRNALLARCLNEMEQVLGVFSLQGFAPFHAEWEACHVWQGCEAQISAANGPLQSGTLLGVAQDGALRLRVEGQEKRVYVGDVSLRRVS